MIELGQRQPMSERRDRWILIGTVLFTSMHFGFAVVASSFGALALVVSNPILSQILYNTGITLALMTMIFAFLLFFVGNLQFRQNAIMIMKQVLTCGIRKRISQPKKKDPKVVSRFEVPAVRRRDKLTHQHAITIGINDVLGFSN